jgi:hypothetical protein
MRDSKTTPLPESERLGLLAVGEMPELRARLSAAISGYRHNAGHGHTNVLGNQLR